MYPTWSNTRTAAAQNRGSPRSLLYLISGILEQDEYDAHILKLHCQIRGTKPYDIEILTEIKNPLGTNDPTHPWVYTKDIT